MKSPYKIVIFLFHISSLIMLTLICFKLSIFRFPESMSWNLLLIFLQNEYVVNILCTIITAVGLYIIQVQYSKYKIRADFRCNEIITDVFDGIQEALILVDDSEELAKERQMISHGMYNVEQKLKAQKNIDFYVKHKHTFYMSSLILTYNNNDILIESVQSVFFINLNFKLLSIVNHIKNRKPTVSKTYSEIENLYKKYEAEPADEIIVSLGQNIESYITHIKFLATYWLELLKYLKYDPIPGKLFIEEFKKRYPLDKDWLTYYKLPISEQRKISRKLKRLARREYFKYKIKNFFD